MVLTPYELVMCRLYVIDRGFADYGFFQAVIEAGSSFQVRYGPPCGT